MSKNALSVVASSLVAKSYPVATYDTVLILTDKATFTEDFQVYQNSNAMLESNDHADLQEASLLLFGQAPTLKTVVVAKCVPSSDPDALVQDMVRLDRVLNVDFFAVSTVSDHANTQIIELGKYIQTQELLGVFSTKEPTAITTDATDLATQFKELNLRNSSVWYHATKPLGLAFIARFLAEKIGLVSAKHLLLTGVESSRLSSTELQNIFQKNGNVYDTERKIYTFTKQGTTCSNENIKTVAGELFLKKSVVDELYTLQLNNSVLSFNKDDLEKVRVAVLKRIKIAQKQKIISENTDKYDGYKITLFPIREESKLEIEIKYLIAGTIKWITIKFMAFNQDEQFILEINRGA